MLSLAIERGELLPGIYVLYAMGGLIPLSLVWLLWMSIWKRLSRDGQSPRSFSLWTGTCCLIASVLLQYQMTPQTHLPSPDHDWLGAYWLLTLILFTVGLPATYIGMMLSRSAGTRTTRVNVCERCGNRDHLHTEYCVRCGHRFLPRRPAADVPPAL